MKTRVVKLELSKLSGGGGSDHPPAVTQTVPRFALKIGTDVEQTLVYLVQKEWCRYLLYFRRYSSFHENSVYFLKFFGSPGYLLNYYPFWQYNHHISSHIVKKEYVFLLYIVPDWLLTMRQCKRKGDHNPIQK